MTVREAVIKEAKICGAGKNHLARILRYFDENGVPKEFANYTPEMGAAIYLNTYWFEIW